MSTEFPSNTIQEIEEHNLCSTTELRRRNASMASTRVFSAEILSYIFSYVLHDVERKERHRQCEFVRLGHICSEWRDIIISTPLLWSKFRVDIAKELYEETPISKVVPYFPLLLLYINNPGNCPFRLDVVFPSYYYTAQEILKQLQQYVPNVHTLTIQGMSWVSELPWSSWLSVENLTIKFLHPHWIDDKRNISFVKFTRLRHLTIHQHTFDRYIQLPGEQITSLELVDVPVDLCMSLLLRCLNLVKFRALQSTEPAPRYHRDLQRPEPTRNLDYLSWSFQSNSACSSVYHQLRFPSLCYLSWYGSTFEGSEDEEMSALRSLVPNLPPTASRLRLTIAYDWSDDFTEFLFVNMRNLRGVYLDHCGLPIIIHFLSLVNRMSDWGGCCILPLLDEVTIEINHSLRTRVLVESKIAPYLLPLFHLRDPYKTRQFTLRIRHYGKTLAKELHEACVSLRKEGYALKIQKMGLD